MNEVDWEADHFIVQTIHGVFVANAVDAEAANYIVKLHNEARAARETARYDPVRY